jgi:hypothetical protein
MGREIRAGADDHEALGPGETLELGADALAHGAASAVATDQPWSDNGFVFRFHADFIFILACLDKLRRKIHLGMRERLQLLHQDRRQAELLEVQAERIGREVGDHPQVPFHDQSLLPVANLPARHLEADAQHLVGNAEGRQHLEGRRVEGARAVVFRERALGLDDAHRHALAGERERGGEAHRAGADDDDGGSHGGIL